MATVAEALRYGWQLHQQGKLKEAERIYRQVLDVSAKDANAWCFLGMACHDQQRFDEAVEAYERALAIQPDFPVALNNLGNTLKQLGRLDESIAACRRAIELDPQYSTAYNNLGVTLVAQGKLSEAIDAFDRALQLLPNDAVALTNLGAAQIRQGEFSAGTSHAMRALQANPNHAEAHKNLGIVALLHGEFERGWREYEWRWQCPGNRLPSFRQPRWDGGPLEGQRLLLYGEQGLGDTIQFVRYASVLRPRAYQIILACQRPLIPLLSRCRDVDVLVAKDDPYPPFDCYIPLMSIPGVLQTTLESIPAPIPYLEPDPDLVCLWKERLAEYEGFKVGIAWQGSPDFHADHQRSIPLACFEPLARLPGVHLISLQKGYGSEQLKELPPEFPVVDLGDDVDRQHGAFMDTAAIMTQLDLVISSCTSVVHLAGAMGVPVWVALSVSPDWRWLLGRDDSPWYPTARLFRQSRMGDWKTVMERMARELAETMNDSGGTNNTVVSLRAERDQATDEDDTLPEAASTSTPDEPFNRWKRCRHGWMVYNRHDMYIGRSLDVYGEYSEAEIELLTEYLCPGDVVVEAGANIGAHTVPLAKHVRAEGRVYAFEPQRILFQTLCANVALNSLTQVICRHAAVGDREGTIQVPLLDYDRTNNFGGLALGAYHEGEKVPLLPLDGLDLPRCDLLKIDVEGMELEVLKGAQATVDRHRPVIYAENDRAARSRQLIECLISWDYQLFWHLPPLFREDNFFRCTENVFARIVSVNMLGIPRESPLKPPSLPAITDPSSDWRDLPPQTQ